jgi:RNA polymerase sigma-70 factor (ECF subfamily)
MHRADPARGRFRNFVKTTLRHLIVDYYRLRRSAPQSLDETNCPPAWERPISELDQALLNNLRDEMVGRALHLLKEAEEHGGPPHATVLRLKVEHPRARSAELAEMLGAKLGKPVTAGNWRQLLDRSRGRLAQYIVDLTAAMCRPRTKEELVEELIDLGLNDHLSIQALAEWVPPVEKPPKS